MPYIHKMISILLTVRNGAQHIKACLDSILSQSEKDWELILIDNQSTDGTAEIIKQVSLSDERIRCYSNEASPMIIEALRLAYSKSKGALITRMDADDIMPTNKLAAMKSALLESGVGHVITGLVKYISDEDLGGGYSKYENWLNGLTLNNLNYQDIYKECVLPSPAWMMHREDFEKSGAYRPDRYPEDYDLCFRCYESGLKMVGVKEVIHHWRDHPSRNSRHDPNYADQLFFDLKLDYFLKIDRRRSQPLYVWGAGRKGKKFARLLIEREIAFHWVTDNPKKIGLDIYGVKMAHTETIDSNAQVLILVSGEEQQTIASDLDKHDIQYYVFC